MLEELIKEAAKIEKERQELKEMREKFSQASKELGEIKKENSNLRIKLNDALEKKQRISNYADKLQEKLHALNNEKLEQFMDSLNAAREREEKNNA